VIGGCLGAQMKGFSEFEFVQRHYFFELDRKQQLESNISLPTGTIVAAFGVLGYYFTHFKFGGEIYKYMYFIEYAFMLATGLALTLLFLATYWCFQAAVGSTYEYLPGSQTLRDYLVALVDWYRKANKRTADKSARLDFELYLIEKMARCNQLNWNTNLVRSEELHKTKRFTVLGLVALATSAVCYYIDFWYDPRPLL
jgi:hypothetical protein